MSKLSHENAPIQECKVADSVLRITREMSRTLDHPARFPVAFADFLIRAFGQRGDIVLDPFLGSGTTLYAAKQLQYRCIGIEIDERYCEMAAIRCSQEVIDFSAQDFKESGATDKQQPQVEMRFDDMQ